MEKKEVEQLWIMPGEVYEEAIVEQRNLLIRALYSNGWKIPSLSKIFNRDKSSISRIVKFGHNTKNGTV